MTVSMMLKNGFTVGKFLPLHKGHQLLIETALREVEHLTVLVYDTPPDAQPPVEVRAQWIRKLYPQVEVIEARNVPTDRGYTEAIQQKHEAFIMSYVGDQKMDAFYSSEPYGERMSKTLGCINRVVDIERNLVRISGTEIRDNLEFYKEFLDPLVYNTMKGIK